MADTFAVVGEHREDPNRLLLVGADGRHDDHLLPGGPTTPVEPGDDWAVDENPPPVEEAVG